MSLAKRTNNSNFILAFLRLMVCILFLPCFFLIDRQLPPLLYLLGLILLIYALLIFLTYQLDTFFYLPEPLTVFLDLLFISLFIYHAQHYFLVFSLFFTFPIVALAFQNKTKGTFFTTLLACTSLILISKKQGLILQPILTQIIILLILACFALTLSRNFHQSCFILANLDTLTKVHNRRFFNQNLHLLIKRNIPFSLILLDLDNFKQLNDLAGHHAGDQILKLTAQLMKKFTRNSDIVARYGGDEFAIILPKTNKEKSKLIATRIRNNIIVHPQIIAYPSLGISVGIAAFPQDGQSAETIIQKADEALYTAKARGKNYVYTC